MFCQIAIREEPNKYKYERPYTLRGAKPRHATLKAKRPFVLQRVNLQAIWNIEEGEGGKEGRK